jgi:hypothetical protein
MLMSKYGQLLDLIFLTIALSSCHFGDFSEKPPSMDFANIAEIFSQEATFSIGNTTLKVPLVTVIDFEHTNVIIPCDQDSEHYCPLSYGSIIKHIENSQVPIPVSALHFDPEGYDLFRRETVQSYDKMQNELCPKLPQKWARTSCPEFGKNPLGISINRFTLIHPDHIAVLESHHLGGSRQNQADLVRNLDSIKHYPQRSCGKDKNGNPSSLCVVALQLDKNLLAVWVVTRKREMEEIRQHSKAIQALVNYGITTKENYPAFKKAIK